MMNDIKTRVFQVKHETPAAVLGGECGADNSINITSVMMSKHQSDVPTFS